MSNVVTMNGDKMRTVADVLHELNEQVAAGDVKSILVVVARPNNDRDIDWSNMPMSEFTYSSTIVYHNMLHQIGAASSHEK